MKTSQISEVQNFEVKNFLDERGDLLILEQKDLPISKFERTFIVSCSKGIVRGNHAHINCTQMMVCFLGSIQVNVDDSKSKKLYQLSSGSALLVPPGIWSTQNYLDDKNILGVWCDMPFEERDYLRDYNDFISYKKLNN